MVLRALLFLAGILPVLSVFSQKHTVSGYIYEKGSKETLIGATIYFPELKAGTITNNYGFYSITLPEGRDSVQLTISYIGYTPVIQSIMLNKNHSLNFEMDPSTNLGEVIVNGSKVNIAQETQMSMIEIPIQQLKNIPALMGEKDVLKALQLLPGVQKGTEGSAGLYVRGGGPDQNLIILDDATVYNANHLFGFFSTFNGDAIKNVKLIKGGFPARYGGRLSSVVDITMKDGDKNKVHGEGGIGLISSRFTVEGPVKKDTCSFLISGRRTYIDVLMFPIVKMIQAQEDLDNLMIGYYFYDLNAKFNYDLDEKNRFYLSGYFGQDKFYARIKFEDYTEKSKLFWGNLTGTARWNHKITPKLFSNLSFISSDFEFGVQDEIIAPDENFLLNYSSGIRDYTLKWDLDYRPVSRHYIKAGTMIITHRFTPEALVTEGSFLDTAIRKENRIYGLESSVFIEDEFTVTEKLNLNGGIRYTSFFAGDEVYAKPEARGALRYLINKDLSAKLAYADMNQYLHLLSNSTPGLPTDLWVPATDHILPQYSQQFSGGLAKEYPDAGWRITLEGYYKRMKNIITYKEGASFFDSGDPFDPENDRLQSFEDKVVAGEGKSYGTEVFIQYDKDNFNGWIGYTLSWTRHRFDSINNGNWYYAKYDRRHDISVVGSYKFNERTRLSMTWVYGTGNALTLQESTANLDQFAPNGHHNSSQTQYLIYGPKNGFRMGAYHRMDIGLQRTKKTKWGERTWEYSVYNAYARANPFYYVTVYDYRKQTNVLKQIALFPLIPSISYNFKF